MAGSPRTHIKHSRSPSLHAGRIVIGEASGSTGVGVFPLHRELLVDKAVRSLFEEIGIG